MINNLRNNSQGIALIWTLVIAMFLTIVSGVALFRSQFQHKEITHRIALQRAFYAAESGVARAIYELRQNASWRPGQGGVGDIVDVPLTINSFDIGYYTVQITPGATFNGWDTLWIRATGKNDRKTLDRIIDARVIIGSHSRFLVSTLGDLRIGSGSVFGTGSTTDADILARDIYFDVNESLPYPAKDITVNGDVNYIRSIHNEGNSAVTITGNVDDSMSITFAGIDFTHYSDLASDLALLGEAVYSAGSGTYHVDLDNLPNLDPGLATTFNPKLIVADGNIEITGTYDHSMLIVAGGNILIGGNIKPNSSGSDRPQIGLFAKNDVIIPDDVTTPNSILNLEAFVVADGGDDSEGAFKAEGDKYSSSTLNFEGSIAVKGGGRTGVDLNVYTTRNYGYNTELKTRSQIPFIPFIVNLVEWKELP